MNFIVFMSSRSSADHANKTENDFTHINITTPQKRDLGYTYSKPFVGNFKETTTPSYFIKSSLSQIKQPFHQYKHHNIPSQQENHGSHTQQRQHQSKYRYNEYKRNHGRVITLQNYQLDNHYKSSWQQHAPSPIRNLDFKSVNNLLISSQNDKPFQPNLGNYLPPKNQKLPNYSSSSLSAHHIFQPQSTFNDIMLKRQNLSDIISDNSQISDGTSFLIQNAEALAQLYNRPASDFDYPPFGSIQTIHGRVQNENIIKFKKNDSSLPLLLERSTLFPNDSPDQMNIRNYAPMISSVPRDKITEIDFRETFNTVQQHMNDISPTHFGLPLPEISNYQPQQTVITKPTTTTTTTTTGSSELEQPTTTVQLLNPAVNPIHLFSIFTTPTAQPILPILPSSITHQIENHHDILPDAYPSYPFQQSSSSINTLPFKPLRPGYPIYYYTNLT